MLFTLRILSTLNNVGHDGGKDYSININIDLTC